MLRENSRGAVVFLKNAEVKYLLLHYAAGHWDFVKGNVEPREHEKETIIRELREETGIVNAKFIDGFKEKITYFYRRRSKIIHKEVLFLLIQTQESKVQLSYEHVGYTWLDYQKAMKRLTFINAKKVLRHAHEFLKKIQNTM